MTFFVKKSEPRYVGCYEIRPYANFKFFNTCTVECALFSV
jgi:hypothetical protein